MPETGGGIGRIKGRCQGVKGGSGHADCVCLEDHVFLAADRSLGCQLQGGEGSWEQTRSERRCTSNESGPPPCGGPGEMETAGEKQRVPLPPCAGPKPAALTERSYLRSPYNYHMTQQFHS